MEQTKKRDHQKLLLLLICLVLIGTSCYFYLQSTKNVDQATQQQQLIARIGKVVALPAEPPVLVTVSDKNKLTNRSLAKLVQDKDLLLIFNNAKRLVIYRDSTKKVVDMVSFAKTSDVPAATPKAKK